MKLDIPEPTKEQKAADVKRLIQNLDSQVDDQAKRAAIRATDTHAPIVFPEGLSQITPEELQFIVLLRLNDDRGQALLFQLATIHSIRYPRSK